MALCLRRARATPNPPALSGDRFSMWATGAPPHSRSRWCKQVGNAHIEGSCDCDHAFDRQVTGSELYSAVVAYTPSKPLRRSLLRPAVLPSELDEAEPKIREHTSKRPLHEAARSPCPRPLKR